MDISNISEVEFGQRLQALHKQLYASAEFEFDAVMRCVYKPPEGYVLTDPQLLHDGTQWHLFYVTGKIEYADAWIAAIRSHDFRHAREIPYEEGDAHAVGSDLLNLEYHSLILGEPQGDFGLGLQGDSAIARYQDHWVNLFSARGSGGTSVCLARSRDLFTWEYEVRNPLLWPPDWAIRPGKYGAAFIVPYENLYLVYIQCQTQLGLGAVQLLTTHDFETFEDQGPVFLMPVQLRGTSTVESPCVVQREGLWHLFVTVGTGTWHIVSNRPDRFMASPALNYVSPLGTYQLGPFHACRVFQAPEGDWYLAGTRKEYQRYLNRKAGVLTFRGSAADEAALLAGLYLCRVRWDGDQPILQSLEEK
jgi:hypothetical protein